MKDIRTALAGYGSGGQIYNAPVIDSVKGFVIHSIMTSSPENKAAATKDFPKAKLVEDFKNILKDPFVDLVVITLPNHLHFEYAKKALEAGKNVIVEKPFTVNYKEALELINLAEKKNLLLSVHHNRRWDSDILTIQKILTEGKLGKIMEFEAHFDRFRNYVKDNWKEKQIPGAGILYDLGSHLIDQALMLFGEPREIFANLQIQREHSDVTDNFELLLLYPDLKVTLKAGMLVKEPGPRYKIFGRKGNYTKFGMDVQEEALKNGKKPKDHPDWGKEPEEIWGILNTEDEHTKVESLPGDYREFYRNIKKSLSGEESPEVKPQQAAYVIKIIELAYKSHKEKRVVSYTEI